MSNSMYGMYSPFNQQYGGMGGQSMWGGGYPSMGGYGQQGGYGGFGGLWGGYNPYGQQGGYGGGYGYNQQPFNGYMGQQPQQQYGGFFDQFDTRMNDLFKQYFSPKDSAASPGGGSADTTPPASGSNATVTGSSGLTVDSETPGSNPAAAVPGANFGNKYAKTGKFGKQGLAQIAAMGYKNQADYLNNNLQGSNMQAEYNGFKKSTPKPTPAPVTLPGANTTGANNPYLNYS